jgi:hypothetical protein
MVVKKLTGVGPGTPVTASPPGQTGGSEPVVKPPSPASAAEPSAAPSPSVTKPARSGRRAALEEQAKKKLAALGEQRAQTHAEIVRLEKELSDATIRVNRLKQRALELPTGSEERSSAVKELGEAQAELDALREADELGGYREERARQKKSEEAILESLELQRPALSASTKATIRQAAKTNAEGKFLDANTGEVIEGEPVYGHKYGREHRRLVIEAREKGMNQEQFTRWVNEHPDWFQLETKANNESHRFEKPGID